MLRPDRTQAVVHGFDEAGPSPNQDTEFGRWAEATSSTSLGQPAGTIPPPPEGGASRGVLVTSA